MLRVNRLIVWPFNCYQFIDIGFVGLIVSFTIVALNRCDTYSGYVTGGQLELKALAS